MLYRRLPLQTEDPNSYFNYAKDWNESEQEDTAGYRQSQQKYGSKSYEYTDSTMTEYYAEGGSCNVSHDVKVAEFKITEM